MICRVLGGVFLLGAAPQGAWAARVTISCGSVGIEFELCRSGAKAWAEKTGNQAEVVTAPASTSERLAQYQLMLAAKAPDIDVFAVDTPWPGMLADFFIDLKSAPKAAAAARQHFTPFIENNTVKQKLVAMPYFIDAGVLYYRKDLLDKHQEQPPKTWNELTRIARRIQSAERASGNPRLWGYVFQGRAYEGLTCNALDWIASSGRGTIVERDGSITVRNPRAVAALELATSWIGGTGAKGGSAAPISPPGVLNYMEEEARGAFQSGNAVFMRNWPYAWKLMNGEDSPVRGKVGFALLPQGDAPGSQSSPTLGGWSLSVSKYSRARDAAIDLVLFLTSAEEQKRRALEAGLHPTLPALYQDPELTHANPMLTQLVHVFPKAVPRPSQATGSKYNRVSAEFWNAVHSALAQKETPQDALTRLEKQLLVISRGGKW